MTSSVLTGAPLSPCLPPSAFHLLLHLCLSSSSYSPYLSLSCRPYYPVMLSCHFRLSSSSSYSPYLSVSSLSSLLSRHAVLPFSLLFFFLLFPLPEPPCWPSGKVSASRAEGSGFESRLRRDFFGVESYQ